MEFALKSTQRCSLVEQYGYDVLGGFSVWIKPWPARVLGVFNSAGVSLLQTIGV